MFCACVKGLRTSSVCFELMHLRYEVTSQCGVFGSHSEPIERDNISHPLNLMDDSIRVRQVGSVGHGGVTCLSDHSVYLCLDFVCEVKGKINWFKSPLWNDDCLIWAPTLDMRIFDEIDEAPLQRFWSGFTPSQEQIQTAQNQVSVLKAILSLSHILSDRVEGSAHERVNFLFTYTTDWIQNVNTILFLLSGRCQYNLVGC